MHFCSFASEFLVLLLGKVLFVRYKGFCKRITMHVIVNTCIQMYLIIVAPENLTDYGKIYLWSPLNPFLTNVPILPPPPLPPPPQKKTSKNQRFVFRGYKMVNLTRNVLSKVHYGCCNRRKQPLAWRPANLLKRDPNTGVFLWNLRNFY